MEHSEKKNRSRSRTRSRSRERSRKTVDALLNMPSDIGNRIRHHVRRTPSVLRSTTTDSNQRHLHPDARNVSNWVSSAEGHGTGYGMAKDIIIRPKQHSDKYNSTLTVNRPYLDYPLSGEYAFALDPDSIRESEKRKYIDKSMKVPNLRDKVLYLEDKKPITDIFAGRFDFFAERRIRGLEEADRLRKLRETGGLSPTDQQRLQRLEELWDPARLRRRANLRTPSSGGRRRSHVKSRRRRRKRSRAMKKK